jgi:hypothetical protein
MFLANVRDQVWLLILEYEIIKQVSMDIGGACRSAIFEGISLRE